jgi:hypothetical protein
MSYLVPYSLAAKPGEKVLHRKLLLTDVPDIPNDTYHLLEWYCPNPDCHCQQALLQVFSAASKRLVANIRIDLDPVKMFDPGLELSEDPPLYAHALFDQIAQYLKGDLAYLSLLRTHYNQVKSVAVDPSHPSHSALVREGKTGKSQPSSTKRKRSRH